MKSAVSPEKDERHESAGTSVTLRGTTYLIRPLCSEDEQRLQEFFYSHSQETIQLRYGCMISTMTHERASELVNVDQQKDVALGIFEVNGTQQQLHAVGRYYSETDPKVAEAAFVVRESKRRCGMATCLLHQLAKIAQERGVTAFRGFVLHDNEAMRSIFARYHPKLDGMPGSDWLTYTIPISSILSTRVRQSGH